MQTGYKIESSVYSHEDVIEIMKLCREDDSELEDVLKRFSAQKQGKNLGFYDIVDAVCEVMGIDTSSIFNGRRKEPLPYTRHLISWFGYMYTHLTLENIRILMEYKNHASIVHGHKLISGELSLYEDTRSLVDQVKGVLVNKDFVLKFRPRFTDETYKRASA